VAILLFVDQYTTFVHASGHRHFYGYIRRVSHLAFGNNYPLHIRQDAGALRLSACHSQIEGWDNLVPVHKKAIFCNFKEITLKT
jgi:hypothetical protein